MSLLTHLITILTLTSTTLALPTTASDSAIAARQQVQCGWLYPSTGGLPDMMKAQDTCFSARPGNPWTKVDNYACRICMTFADDKCNGEMTGYTVAGQLQVGIPDSGSYFCRKE